MVLELKAGVGLAQPAVLDHGRGRADVGGRAAGRAQVTLVQEFQQLLFSRATSIRAFAFADHVHGGGQVPHLDAAIGVAREQVAPRPRAHPAGALALSHRERGYGGAVNGLDLADSVRDGVQCEPQGRMPFFIIRISAKLYLHIPRIIHTCKRSKEVKQGKLKLCFLESRAKALIKQYL